MVYFFVFFFLMIRRPPRSPPFPSTTLSRSAATRDAARVLGFDYGAGDRLAKMIPDPIMGRPPSFDDCLKPGDRKSTRLNSSHANISYAVFCLKKKKITNTIYIYTRSSKP